MLLFSVLITLHYVLPDTITRNRKELRAWQRRVENDAPRQEQLGARWAPLADSIEWNSQGQILSPLEDAVTVWLGPSGIIETAAGSATSAPEAQRQSLSGLS